MKTFILLICLCFYGLGEQSCNSKAQNSKSEKPNNNNKNILSNSETQEQEYEILDIGCTEDERCIVIAYCPPTLFNKEDMEKIVEKLSVQFNEKKLVNVNLFDKRDIAEAYAKGIRDLGGLSNERRGWYFRNDNKEFLLFFPDGIIRNKPVSVKPKKGNN